MNTLVALTSTAVDLCVPTKLSLDAPGLCPLFVSSGTPGSGHFAYRLATNYTTATFGTSSILLLKAAATATHSLEVPPLQVFQPIAYCTLPMR
jgi:hypothetical protein